MIQPKTKLKKKKKKLYCYSLKIAFRFINAIKESMAINANSRLYILRKRITHQFLNSESGGISQSTKA